MEVDYILQNMQKGYCVIQQIITMPINEQNVLPAIRTYGFQDFSTFFPRCTQSQL